MTCVQASHGQFVPAPADCSDHDRRTPTLLTAYMKCTCQRSDPPPIDSFDCWPRLPACWLPLPRRCLRTRCRRIKGRFNRPGVTDLPLRSNPSPCPVRWPCSRLASRCWRGAAAARCAAHRRSCRSEPTGRGPYPRLCGGCPAAVPALFAYALPVLPPSIANTVPVQYDASSEARYKHP